MTAVKLVTQVGPVVQVASYNICSSARTPLEDKAVSYHHCTPSLAQACCATKTLDVAPAASWQLWGALTGLHHAVTQEVKCDSQHSSLHVLSAVSPVLPLCLTFNTSIKCIV